MSYSSSSQVNSTVNAQNKVNRTSYAAMAQQCPSRKQAIAMDIFDGLSNQNYGEGIATLIDPLGITHISELAEELEEILHQLKIKECTVPMRPSITKGVRVIISNATAHIPISIIKEKLIKYGVNPLSEIPDIEDGLIGQMDVHILSFRKQVIVKPEDEAKIDLRISLDNIDQIIFVSTEKMICFLHHTEGHQDLHFEMNNRETNPTTLIKLPLERCLSAINMEGTSAEKDNHPLPKYNYR
ncbi:hypothetical protein HHI36_004742 [Cryptolaemus montrouzieri]|uniref:Uncharacterized protein n=1 Tax=Cryptolaemus montrouzieri TaxID=559131 RepID=A0ABD2NSD5_9CUCU